MKEKVYMVCDWFDKKASEIQDAPDIGVEYMGMCHGRILKEDGALIGEHSSSSFGWLRLDLQRYLPKHIDFEVIDLIGKEMPEEFVKI